MTKGLSTPVPEDFQLDRLANEGSQLQVGV